MGNKKAESKFRITAGGILLLLVVLYFIVLIRTDWKVLLELQTQRANLKQEITCGREEKARLKKEISLLDTYSYIELLAREKLGLIKRGERAYKVVK